MLTTVVFTGPRSEKPKKEEVLQSPWCWSRGAEMSQGLLVNGGLVKGGSDAQESANKFDRDI